MDRQKTVERRTLLGSHWALCSNSFFALSSHSDMYWTVDKEGVS